MYLKRSIFNFVLKLIADDSVDILSTSRNYDLDLIYIYLSKTPILSHRPY